MTEESKDFFKSDVVRESLEDIQTTYTELLKMSAGFAEYDIKKRVEHIDKTLELIAKQKVFYARLQLAAHSVNDDETAKEIKDRIEEMSGTYAPGLNLTAILDTMEEKLRFWREQIKQGVDTA